MYNNKSEGMEGKRREEGKAVCLPRTSSMAFEMRHTTIVITTEISFPLVQYTAEEEEEEEEEEKRRKW